MKRGDMFQWDPRFWREWTEGSQGTVRDQYESQANTVIMRAREAGAHLVLDAGCGHGRLAYRLSEVSPAQIVGVDASQSMIKAAAERLKETGRFEPVYGSLESLPFSEHSFDLIVCIGVVNHVRDEEQVLRELARVLKPTGKILLTFNNIADLLWIPYKAYMKLRQPVGYRQHFRSLGFFISLFEERGLSCRVIDYGFAIPGIQWLRGLSSIVEWTNSLLASLLPFVGWELLLEIMSPKTAVQVAADY